MGLPAAFMCLHSYCCLSVCAYVCVAAELERRGREENSLEGDTVDTQHKLNKINMQWKVTYLQCKCDIRHRITILLILLNDFLTMQKSIAG